MSSTLHCIASGSSANCYILTAGENKLVLEAGVSDKLLLKVLNYKLEGVSGVLVSHKHADHSKYIPQIAKYFPIYSNEDVAFRFSNADNYAKVKILQPKKCYKIGAFTVMPLEVEHGVPNFAYLIWHELTGWIVFCTDAVSFPYKLRELVSTVIMECNYVEGIVLRNMLNNDDVRSQVDMHMELSQSVEAVKRLQNPLLRNVILCHLSSANADRVLMTERFEQELGIEPKFAVKGAVFDVKQFEF